VTDADPLPRPARAARREPGARTVDGVSLLALAARAGSQLYALVWTLPADRATRRIERMRARQRSLDRALGAIGRYQQVHAARLAATISYYGFLALAPLVLLASSVLGYLLAGSPDRQLAVLSHISDYLPAQFARELVTGATASRRSAGVLGLILLAIAGLGWVDSLRVGIRTIWNLPEYDVHPILRRVVDLFLLVGLGLAFFATIVVSVAGTAASGAVFRWLDLDGALARWVVRLFALLVALAANVVLFTFVLSRVPRHRVSGRRVLGGAVLAGLGFEVLKLVGTYYLAYATRYSTGLGGTAVGLLGGLIWLNVASRLTLFSAAWATAGTRRGVS
jgi:membrane protein